MSIFLKSKKCIGLLAPSEKKQTLARKILTIPVHCCLRSLSETTRMHTRHLNVNFFEIQKVLNPLAVTNTIRGGSTFTGVFFTKKLLNILIFAYFISCFQIPSLHEQLLIEIDIRSVFERVRMGGWTGWRPGKIDNTQILDLVISKFPNSQKDRSSNKTCPFP